MKVQLSEDRTVLKIVQDLPKGILESEFTSESPDGFTDEQVDYAIKNVSNIAQTMVVGETKKAKIIGPFFLYKDTGPPTWWFPRIGYKTRAFRFGWLRWAFAIGLRKGKD